MYTHTCICYGPIANRWLACKQADLIVSRSAGYSGTGSWPLWFESRPGAANRTRTSLGLGNETQYSTELWSALEKGTVAQCVALVATTRRHKLAYRVPSLWLYSKVVTVSFGAR